MTTGCSSAAPQQHNSRYVTLINFAGRPPPSVGQGYLFPKMPALWRNGNVMSKSTLFS